MLTSDTNFDRRKSSHCRAANRNLCLVNPTFLREISAPAISCKKMPGRLKTRWRTVNSKLLEYSWNGIVFLTVPDSLNRASVRETVAESTPKLAAMCLCFKPRASLCQTTLHFRSSLYALILLEVAILVWLHACVIFGVRFQKLQKALYCRRTF